MSDLRIDMTTSPTTECEASRKVALQRRPAVRRPKHVRMAKDTWSMPDDALLSPEDRQQECLEGKGSSLDLAPSLLNIYDSLAASSDHSGTAEQHVAHYGCRPEHEDWGRDHVDCVQAVWVTQCNTQQRLLLPCVRTLSGRPLSSMELSSVLAADKDKEAKKRPLSVSSLSSVSSTSLPRLYAKRRNLSHDAQDDQSFCTSSTSTLASTSSLVSSTDPCGDSDMTVEHSCHSIDSPESDDSSPTSSVTAAAEQAGSRDAEGGNEPSSVPADDQRGECVQGTMEEQITLRCSGGVSSPRGRGPRPEPIVMTPLQNTLRPVVLSVPGSMRRLSPSSATTTTTCGSGDGDLVPQLQSGGDSVEKITAPSQLAGKLGSVSSSADGVGQQTWTPLSPTAMARRKFLSTHFDLPDLPPMEVTCQQTHSPAGHELSSAGLDSSPSGCQGATAAESVSDCSTSETTPATDDGCVSPSPEDGPREVDAALEVKGDCDPGPAAVGSGATPPDPRGSQSRSEEWGQAGVRGQAGASSYVTYAQRVVTEIVETERIYIESLEAIIRGYLEPLEELQDVKVAHDDLMCLFCNIRDIYDFGKVFLADLEHCGLDPIAVAECFVRHSNGFVIYTQYCTNYPRAVEVLTRFMQDPQLSEVCKKCQKALGHGLPLGAYLLRPVQRILKYHLLLQNILKNFDKSRAGYGMLEKAFEQMTDMAHHINEMKRRHEHAVRIQEVQSQLEDYRGDDLTRLGELVAEGSFRVYGAKTTRQVFLFEKGILVAKKKEGGMLTCKAFILCSNLMLVEVIPNEPLSFQIIPFDNPRAQHTLQARSMEQKLHWCQAIKQLILASFKSIPDNVKNLVMALGRGHDSDNPGKDSFDSPWKHQHLAPEYLEKRRVKGKLGGKASELLLKPQKPASGAKQQAGPFKKSPKPRRQSESKSPTGGRDRTESLPEMLAKTSLPGIGALGVGAPAVGAPPAFITGSSGWQGVLGTPPESSSTTTSSNSNSLTLDPASQQNPSDPGTNGIQLRASSFRRALRMKPVTSQDLTSLETPNAAPSAEESYRRPESERKNKDSTTSFNDSCQSSPSDNGESSDTDSGEQPGGKCGVGSNPHKSSMYSSMPALDRVPAASSSTRRPSQQAKSDGANLKRGEFSKSSDSLSGDNVAAHTVSSDVTNTKRQYRRRWEAADDGLNKKVPALYDTYQHRSRENQIRNRAVRVVDGAKQDGRGAKLTNWGSVDKLTHGSLTDLSHLKEDPWVRNPHSLSGESANSYMLPSHAAAAKLRSRSLSAAQTTDWNPSGWSPKLHSNENLDRLSSGKENLDWLVYLNRNSADPDIRGRANSLSKLSGSSPHDVKLANTLKDSNATLKSNLLCRDSKKRYSLHMSDRDRDRTRFLEGGKAPAAIKRELSGSMQKGFGSCDRLGYTDEVVLQGHVDQHLATKSVDPNLSTNLGQAMEVMGTTSPASVARHQAEKLISKPSVPLARNGCSSHENLVTLQKQDDCEQAFEDIPPVSSTRQGGATWHRPTSQSADLSLEEHKIAEMEKYCDTNSPKVTLPVGKFPFHGDHSYPTQQTLFNSDDININRLSGTSTISSSSNEGSFAPHHDHVLRDPNPNRLSGVSSISTSSYDSVTSNSSDSLVGTFKSKLSALTHKLGRKSRDEECQGSSNKDGHVSPTPGKAPAELQEVLRGHALGSSLIGSRMANIAPVGSSPMAKPDAAHEANALSLCDFDDPGSTPKPSSDFPTPHSRLTETEAEGTLSVPSDQSLTHSTKSGDQLSDPRLSVSLESASCLVQDSSTAGMPDVVMPTEHHGSCSSLDSADSFYERRLSVAFESDIFVNSNPYGNNQREMDLDESRADGKVIHRKSIREVVQFIEEKFKPRQPTPREVRRREPSTLIRQRLQSLHNSAVYRPHISKRSVSEDRSRRRDRTPPPLHTAAQRSSRPESRGNQFMHRAHSGHVSRADASTEQEHCNRNKARREENAKVDDAEVFYSNCASRMDQQGSDVDSLVIMRGWVRSLITKFQQAK